MNFDRMDLARFDHTLNLTMKIAFTRASSCFLYTPFVAC